MSVPEQVLHAVLVLTWDADDAENKAAEAQAALELPDSDREDAAAHIESHRGNGDWGGRVADIEARARERVQIAIEEGMLPKAFDSILAEPEDNGEVDPFEELGVMSPEDGAAAAGDALEAFMDEEDDEDPVAEPVQEEVEEEEDDDEDPFAALGVAGPAVALSTLDEDDPLAALMDDEDDEDDDDEEDEAEDEPAVEEEEDTSSAIDAKAAYLMVLETVWVDGVLDPGEVSLLARRRKELGLSFEEHLALVRKMLG
ncbi:MAG TPA: hypothetical protein EYQ80_04005 [Candidatus Poseidoniales archaeon]|nr:hypothetical protein [Candidatus Poseidoniales archaeon]